MSLSSSNTVMYHGIVDTRDVVQNWMEFVLFHFYTIEN